MYQTLNDYLAFVGMKYMKPEKAGSLADEMKTFKEIGQAARQSFTTISKALEAKVVPFRMDRVSNWANQAQIGRPHFWCYYQQPNDQPDAPGIAIRLYGEQNAFGISLEVSFIERKKSGATLAKQAKVLAEPIEEPLYYFVQINGLSHREAGTEENRLRLQEEVAAGDVRKVLVKYDVPMTAELTLDELTDQLTQAFEKVLPYYEASKK